MTPRGIRNFNPLNIKRGIAWDGLAAKQIDDTFDTFDTAVWGIRAAAKILLTYQRKHGLETVREMIDRWAPPSENDTESYIAHVARQMDVEPDEPIGNLEDMPTSFAAMLETMILHENGQQPYPADVIVRAIDMAVA